MPQVADDSAVVIDNDESDKKEQQTSINQIRQNAGSPLIVEGHSNQSDGGVKIGRFNTVVS